MPDPNDYSAVLVMKGYGGLKASVLRATEKLRADGQIIAAREVSAAFLELTDELAFIAKDVALIATAKIKDAEQFGRKSGRVRPDTGSDRGSAGARLEDFLGESVPYPGVPGTVLVNDESLLEKNVPWWWTNEEGYSGFIGRKLQGYFFDAGWSGKSRPDVSQSRVHPLFRGKMVGGDQKGAEIKNPIPERRFVKHGLDAAEAEWHTRVRAARRRFDDRIKKSSVLARQPVP